MNALRRVMTFVLIGAIICIGLAFGDDFSDTKYFYRVDYLKPVGGNSAIINAIFAKRPNVDQAETFYAVSLNDQSSTPIIKVTSWPARGWAKTWSS